MPVSVARTRRGCRNPSMRRWADCGFGRLRARCYEAAHELSGSLSHGICPLCGMEKGYSLDLISTSISVSKLDYPWTTEASSKGRRSTAAPAERAKVVGDARGCGVCAGMSYRAMGELSLETLLIDLAGRSRATASGCSLSAIAGASLGGLMLALGGFPLLGVFVLERQLSPQWWYA